MTLEGTAARPRGDFGVYLLHRGYAATFRVDRIDERAPPSNPVLRVAGMVRGALRRSLQRVFPEREAGLLMGLALGDTSRLDPHVEETFRATGLSHLTAVSGENVAMFLAPVLAVAAMLGLGRRGRFAVGLSAVGFFVLMTRAEPSVLRAAVMVGLTMLGIFLGRPRSPPAIVAGAVLLLLALNPTLVYAIGFQLSVAATVGMALLAGPLASRIGGRVRFAPRAVVLAAGTTLGAQAGVTQLLLYHFGAVPTVTLAANLLAFPAVALAMPLGLAAAAAGLLAKPVGIAVAGVALGPLRYLEGLADWLARSPVPTITSGTGRLSVLVGWSAAVAGGAWLIRHPRRRTSDGASGGRLRVRAAVLLVPVVLWTAAFRAGPPAGLTVTFFDVGQGDAALVRSPGGAAILIDGGPDAELVSTKLAALGVRRLDLIVATHPHADHVAGLTAVLARFPVGMVIDPGCRGDSPYYRAFLAAVRGSHVPFRHPLLGMVLVVGDVHVQVLGPERCFTGTDSDPNNDSLILRLTDAGGGIMFPGDAEEPSQTDLLRDEPAFLAAPVLKVPHHGGATSLDAFLRATRARIAVVSVGPNRYGHPVPALLARLVALGMRVYRTDRSGDVTVSFEHGAILVRTSRR